MTKDELRAKRRRNALSMEDQWDRIERYLDKADGYENFAGIENNLMPKTYKHLCAQKVRRRSFS